MTISTEHIITSLTSLYGESVTTGDIRLTNNVGYPTVTKRLTDYKVGRGKWDLSVQEIKEELEETYKSPSVENHIEQNLIPQKDDTFVQFGNFKDLKSVIKSGLFYPTFITGLSGNGKTLGVEQSCATTQERTDPCQHYYRD